MEDSVIACIEKWFDFSSENVMMKLKSIGLHEALSFTDLEQVVAALKMTDTAGLSQCWQGAKLPEAVVSPIVQSSNILRVPSATSLAQCVAACCDMPDCDLAWMFERHCYILSCQQRENCRPRERPGSDSYLAFLWRTPPQTLVLQSLVRGEPLAQSSEAPGDVEALKDLALFNRAQQDLGDPGMMDPEYLEGSPEERGMAGGGGGGGSEAELPPSWRDKSSESESKDGLGELPTETSLSQNSTPSEGNTSQEAQYRDTTSNPTPQQKEDGEVHSKSEASTDTISITPSPQKPTPDATQQNLIRTSSPTQATPHPPSALPVATPTGPARTLNVSLGDPVLLTLPMDTVELEASVHPEPPSESFYNYDWYLMSSTDGHVEAIEGEHNHSVTLSRLSAGLYVVTVSVSGQGANGEGAVNITVREAPRLTPHPKALVFPSTQVLSPPAGNVIINASKSKMAVSCGWEQMSGSPVHLGDSTNRWILNLSNLDPGNYTFRLMVTDAFGASDSTTATVMVLQAQPSIGPINHQEPPLAKTTTSDPAVTSPLPTTPPPFVRPSVTAPDRSGDRPVSIVEVGGSNHGPVAVVGTDRKLVLPVSRVVLDGSGSTDDHAIVSYRWDPISGPPGLKMEGADKAIATATGLRVGRYTFSLTVSDQEGETDTATLTVRVLEARILHPMAHASGSHTLTLPNNSLVLRGSVTDGDQAEVQYLWVRDNQSPAAGDVLYGSKTQASLYLANLVEGTYLFQLRVTDAQGQTSTATATVEVRPEPGGGEEVEVEMLVAVSQVSVAQRDTVLRQLAALLHVLENDIHLTVLQGHSHLSTVLRFSVRGPEGPVPGSNLARVLRNQLLKEKTDYLLFRVVRVDTVLCLLHCSGRGQCDPITKECVCDPFWTENLIRRLFGDGESNCEWRVLYVILSSFVVIIFVLSVSWTFICCCKRRRRTKVRKKTKYTILDNMDDQERVELRPKYSIKHRSTEHNSSLMMSESEMDSDYDTIFSRDRPVRSRNRAHANTVRNGNAFG
ncbi:dyslexia-associated protein KIAA0319 [Lampris incognitus]|uniref:dyslexia-associated protein KIAA0319 n=1 Tax=Lampris incognitus TaxID=2546036 RepID=UPI0024B517F1|nr:dyslexia-associated protein KIAA0319 [Lampris incognitus]